MTSSIGNPFRGTGAPVAAKTCGPDGTAFCGLNPAVLTLGDNTAAAATEVGDATGPSGGVAQPTPPPVGQIVTSLINEGGSAITPQSTSIQQDAVPSSVPGTASSSSSNGGGSNLSSGAVAGVAIGW